MPDTPLLLINIGWMVSYAGVNSVDPISGGFGHLKDHSYGHEAWNFAPLRGKLHGYIPGSRRVELKNLGAPNRASSVEGVTVVWIARHPSTKKTYVVGWYENATVFDELRYLTRGKNYRVEYRVEASASDATLLPPDQRTFLIPTAKEKGNLGQSPVWYGGFEKFRAKIRKYVASGGVPEPTKKSHYNLDHDARKIIELAAIKHATDYYSSVAGGSRQVDSVERDAAGWDLTVTGPGDEILKVEVKGCSGADCVAELTPNEYKQMRAKEHRRDYVIYVVTNASSKRELAHIFRFIVEESSRDNLVWRSQDGRDLKIEERVGAGISSC